MKVIKAIVKWPAEEAGHIEYMENTLEAFQKIVGGYIEVVTKDGFVIVCNEEGKLLEMDPSFRHHKGWPDRICGTAVICGTDGDEFADVPFDLGKWTEILKEWGN